jgi:hypothetical protein
MNLKAIVDTALTIATHSQWAGILQRGFYEKYSVCHDGDVDRCLHAALTGSEILPVQLSASAGLLQRL